jgi:hypothetical protein
MFDLMTSANSQWSRLRQPLFLWWAAGLATKLAVDWLLKYRVVNSPARSLLVLLPPLIWTFVIMAFVQAIFKLDELQRRIHLQAGSFAFVLAAGLIWVLAGLERAGIYHATMDGVGGLLIFLWMISYVFSAWKYR